MRDTETPATEERASWTVRVLGAGLGTILTLGSLGWAADLYRAVGLLFMNEQFYAALLAVGLALVFIVMPAARGSPRLRVPWYDAVAALVGVAAGGYVAFNYERIFEEIHLRAPDALISAVIILGLVIEGFQGRHVDVTRMFIYLGLDSNGLLGIAMRVSTTIVIA